MDFSPEYAQIHLSRPLYHIEAAERLVETNKLSKTDDPFEFMRKIKCHPKVFPSRDPSLQAGVNGVWCCTNRTASRECGELNLPIHQTCRRCRAPIEARGMAIVDEYVAVLKRALFQPQLPLGVHVEAEARRTAELQRPPMPPVPPPQEMGVGRYGPGPESRGDRFGERGVEGGRFGGPGGAPPRDPARHTRDFDARSEHLNDVPGPRRESASSAVPQRMRFDPERGLVPVGSDPSPKEAAPSKRMRFDPKRGLIPVEDGAAGRGDRDRGSGMKEMARQAYADLKNKTDMGDRDRRTDQSKRSSRFSDRPDSNGRGRDDKTRPRRESRFSDKPPQGEPEAPVKRIRIDPFAGAVEVPRSSKGGQEPERMYRRQDRGYDGQSERRDPSGGRRGQGYPNREPSQPQSQGYQPQQTPFGGGQQQHTQDAPAAGRLRLGENYSSYPRQNQQEPQVPPADRLRLGENYSYPQFQSQQETGLGQPSAGGAGSSNRYQGYDQNNQKPLGQQQSAEGITRGPSSTSMYMGLGRMNQGGGGGHTDSNSPATGSEVGGLGLYRGLSGAGLGGKQQPAQQGAGGSQGGAGNLQSQLSFLNQQRQQYSQQSAAAEKQIQQMLALNAGNSSSSLLSSGSGGITENKNMMQGTGNLHSSAGGGGEDVQKQMAFNMMFLAHQERQKQKQQEQPDPMSQRQQQMLQGSQGAGYGAERTSGGGYGTDRTGAGGGFGADRTAGSGGGYGADRAAGSGYGANRTTSGGYGGEIPAGGGGRFGMGTDGGGEGREQMLQQALQTMQQGSNYSGDMGGQQRYGNTSMNQNTASSQVNKLEMQYQQFKRSLTMEQGSQQGSQQQMMQGLGGAGSGQNNMLQNPSQSIPYAQKHEQAAKKLMSYFQQQQKEGVPQQYSQQQQSSTQYPYQQQQNNRF